jgi:hypothetical protein
MISSRKIWERKLAAYEKDSGCDTIRDVGLKYWDSHRFALDLFRSGGFATLDEFCKLAGTKFQTEVNGLRGLVRAALGLFNPENHFEKSEYYGFVQALFKEDLFSLREDVAVLTYNYDPYLEFLLYRALDQRWKVRRGPQGRVLVGPEIQSLSKHETQLEAATSGFYSQQGLNRSQSPAWLHAEPSFSVLQLHGSICFALDNTLGFETLFEGNSKEGADCLFNEAAPIAPVMFPWEIMTDNGFVDEKSFVMQNIYRLFRGIWEKARREVQEADKISFVGLSMHQFLFDGLQYLFHGKQGAVEVVVANPDNTVFVQGKSGTHWNHQPHSSAFAVSRVLSKVAAKMSVTGRNPPHGEPRAGEITIVEDFAGFVKTQMTTTAGA